MTDAQRRVVLTAFPRMDYERSKKEMLILVAMRLKPYLYSKGQVRKANIVLDAFLFTFADEITCFIVAVTRLSVYDKATNEIKAGIISGLRDVLEDELADCWSKLYFSIRSESDRIGHKAEMEEMERNRLGIK